MNVFDSSALLGYLLGEPGREVVREQLEIGGICGAANWAEVAQKTRAGGADWDIARGLLMSFPLSVEAVTSEDAERAASIWRRGEGLSLGDRLCLALGERHAATVWTCDSAWEGRPRVRLVR